MLTVAKIPAPSAAGYAEYLQAKTQATGLGDYYLKDGDRVETPGRWIGAATTIGADPTAQVQAEQLRALMAVRRPDTGRPLRPVGGDGTAVAAIDATFSAPKSVSAVWALGDPELRAAVERAHEVAVDRAMRYAVAQVAMIRERVGRGNVIHTTAADVIATAWRHTTARAVADQVPDPQLHTHVLLHASVRKDGRLVAIDSRVWFMHRRELGAGYRTELAHELSQIGFTIRRGTGRGGRYFEIDGIPQAVIDRWSSRHHQVQQDIQARITDKQAMLRSLIAQDGGDAMQAQVQLDQLEAFGQLPAAEDRQAAWATRSAKTPTTSHDLDRHWTQTAHRLQFGRPDLQRMHQTSQLPPMPATPAALLGRLTEFDATFEGREARAVALEASAGVPIADALRALAQLSDTGDLLDLADGRHTTLQHRRVEHETVQLAAELAAGHVQPISGGLAARHAARLDEELRRSGGQLSPEQTHALLIACSSSPLVVIEGQAGTGKSTALTGIARAHHDDGQTIIATSTAALAAHRLATELTTAGVPTDAYSTAALQAAITSGRVTLSPGTTVIHDEAALASTREQHHLLAAVRASGARLILVGDPRQSQPVGAGGLWCQIVTTAQRQDAHISLTENVRALNAADRRDQARFRGGEHEEAILGYGTRSRILIADQQRQAEDAALDAAQADHQSGKRTLVIAQTSNDHLDQLNARAQAIRHQHGELGADSLPIPGRPYQLHPGDHIQIRHTITHPTHGQVRNGTTARITHINPHTDQLTLALGHDRHAHLDRQQINQADLRLAYVQHPFPAQGTTTDTTHLIASDHATQEGTYVALTRARHTTHIYTSHQQLDHPNDPVPALADHLSRTEPETPSITTPLAHETQLTTQHTLGYNTETTNRPTPAPSPSITSDAQRPAPTLHATAVPVHRGQSECITDVLGPPPDPNHPTHASWQQAATAVQDYRHKYAIPNSDPRLLGPEPAPAAFEQRLDRRATAARVNDARTALDTPALSRGDEHEHDLSNHAYPSREYDSPGWEL